MANKTVNQEGRIMATKNPRGVSRPKDGRGQGTGRGAGKNTGGCSKGNAGKGTGKGQGSGTGRKK